MREIKFRAWDGETMLDRTLFDRNWYAKNKCCRGAMPNDERTLKVMQFTGLKDCNGVDIYEGDIVESNFYAPEIKEVAEIGYCDHLMKFIFISGEQDAFEYGALTVIGNIYENKGLL